MQLRVFQHTEGKMAVEVSTPQLPDHEYRWLVPLIPQSELASLPESSGDVVRVSHHDRKCFALSMLIRTVPANNALWKEFGVLNHEDSINVLNHIHDRLAYE